MTAEALLDGEADALTRKAIELALEGDTTAMRLCLERLLPPRKERPIQVDVPSIESKGDALKALRAALADGELTPDEVKTVVSVLGAMVGIADAFRPPWYSRKKR